MEVRPGYKLSEVGIIPDIWLVKALRELFDFRNGVNADKEAYGRGIPFINVLQPINHSHIFGSEITGQVALPESVVSAYEVHRGDVLFNRTSETQEEVGLAAAYLGSDRVIFGGFVIRGRPVDDTLDPTYSGYALRAPVVRSQIIPMGQGAIRANIGQESLRKVLVPVPPLEEQRAIAHALRDVDELVGALGQLIVKKHNLKQAVTQQLLTGSARLPGHRDEWETKSFDEVLLRVNAKAYQVQTSDYRAGGSYPIVDQGKERVVGFSDNGDKCFLCPEGGVIVFGDHTCIVKFVDFDFVVGADGTQVLKAKPGQSTKFHALQLQYRGIEPTGYNRHFKLLKEREFLIPPYAEQVAIAEILTEVDAELMTLEKQLTKTLAIKQGMAQQLLTGRTRLTTAEVAHGRTGPF